jgi:hypothetical protein
MGKAKHNGCTQQVGNMTDELAKSINRENRFSEIALSEKPEQSYSQLLTTELEES